MRFSSLDRVGLREGNYDLYRRGKERFKGAVYLREKQRKETSVWGGEGRKIELRSISFS